MQTEASWTEARSCNTCNAGPAWLQTPCDQPLAHSSQFRRSWFVLRSWHAILADRRILTAGIAGTGLVGTARQAQSNASQQLGAPRTAWPFCGKASLAIWLIKPACFSWEASPTACSRRCDETAGNDREDLANYLGWPRRSFCQGGHLPRGNLGTGRCGQTFLRATAYLFSVRHEQAMVSSLPS